MLINIEYSKIQIRKITADEFKEVVKEKSTRGSRYCISSTNLKTNNHLLFSHYNKKGLDLVTSIGYAEKRIETEVFTNVFGKKDLELMVESIHKDFEYYLLEEGNTYFTEITNKSIEEKRVIATFIGDLQKYINHKDIGERYYRANNPTEFYWLTKTMETLVRSLRIEKVNKIFYNTPRKLADLFSTVKDEDLVSDVMIYPKNSLIYKESEFDVLDVINILVDSNDSWINIGIDYNVVDNIRSISDPGHDTTEEDVWVRVHGKLGNSSRENLCITYFVDTEVDVPKNDVGIPEGKLKTVKERNLCIIKDGYYWKNTLHIRVSPEVYEKLKATGVELEEVGIKGEYRLNLKSLPLYSFLRIQAVNLTRIGDLLAERRELEWRKDCYLFKKNQNKTEKEKFLESLDIYDGVYRDTKHKTLYTGRKSKGERHESDSVDIVYSLRFNILTMNRNNVTELNSDNIISQVGPESIDEFNKVKNQLIDSKLVISSIGKFQEFGAAIRKGYLNGAVSINWKLSSGLIDIPKVPYNW